MAETAQHRGGRTHGADTRGQSETRASLAVDPTPSQERWIVLLWWAVALGVMLVALVVGGVIGYLLPV